MHTFLTWSVIICWWYLAAVFAAFVLMLIGSALEHAVFVRQRHAEDDDVLAESRFTIPVSVIAPAYNEALVIESCLRSLLAFKYPEFEVVVVNDGSTDDTLDVLQRLYDLQPVEMFYRKRFETATVRGIYRSRTHANLVVVDKDNGGKADALNAGLNLARYRYICTVDSDTVYVPDALLKSMRYPMRDPATVVGVTSNVTISRRPEDIDPSRPDSTRIDTKPLTNFQLLDFLRAFLINRLGWTRWNFMLCSVGAFAIWRRDIVMELGGFSGAFTCEDIELTFRVHHHMRREGRPYRIVALPDSIGRTEGPDTVRSLISQRARWQRVITETVWNYRGMLLNPKYGSVGMIGVPYYVLVEVLSPVFQTLSIVSLAFSLAVGVLDVRQFLLMAGTITCATGALTNMAILLNDRSGRAYPLADLVKLMLLSLADLVLYRPILMFAQAKGLVDFLRGDKSWNKFARNAREPRRSAAAPAA